MSKGKAKCNYLDMQGHAAYQTVPSWDFLYEASTVKSEKWNIGDRVVTPDGRVFRYSKATAECSSGFGAFNTAAVNISGSLAANAAAGVNEVSVTIAAGDGFAEDGVIAEDELRGGYIVIGNNTSDPENRCILGNTAVAAGGGTCTVYLDAALSAAVTTASYCEVMLNPYAHLTSGDNTSDEYSSAMGVAVANAAAGEYFWVQTWGILWITPGGATTPGDSVNDRTVVFVGDGSLNGVAHITLENGYQVAGFIVQKDSTGSGGPPFVMLQISI